MFESKTFFFNILFCVFLIPNDIKQIISWLFEFYFLLLLLQFFETISSWLSQKQLYRSVLLLPPKCWKLSHVTSRPASILFLFNSLLFVFVSGLVSPGAHLYAVCGERTAFKPFFCLTEPVSLVSALCLSSYCCALLANLPLLREISLYFPSHCRTAGLQMGPATSVFFHGAISLTLLHICSAGNRAGNLKYVRQFDFFCWCAGWFDFTRQGFSVLHAVLELAFQSRLASNPNLFLLSARVKA